MDVTGAIALCLGIGLPVIGLPWLIMHYVTKWKSQTGISQQAKHCSMNSMISPAGSTSVSKPSNASWPPRTPIGRTAGSPTCPNNAASFAKPATGPPIFP